MGLAELVLYPRIRRITKERARKAAAGVPVIREHKPFKRPKAAAEVLKSEVNNRASNHQANVNKMLGMLAFYGGAGVGLAAVAATANWLNKWLLFVPGAFGTVGLLIILLTFVSSDESLVPTRDEEEEQEKLRNAATDEEVAQIDANRLSGRTEGLHVELKKDRRGLTASVYMAVTMIVSAIAVFLVMFFS